MYLLLLIYSTYTSLFLEVFFRVWSIYNDPTFSQPDNHVSFIWLMFTSGLYPVLIFIAFFVGLFIGQKRAFTILLTIIGFYMVELR